MKKPLEGSAGEVLVGSRIDVIGRHCGTVGLARAGGYDGGMDEPSELMPNTQLRDYSLTLAGLAVDALIDAHLIAKSDCEMATIRAAVELYIRFSINDLPPKDS
jgi:hypothetical protein